MPDMTDACMAQRNVLYVTIDETDEDDDAEGDGIPSKL
jgi:hypothetical protein